MYEMGMDIVEPHTVGDLEPDYLVCIGCSVEYINGTSELRDLGDVYICIETDEFYDMATNWGATNECASCDELRADMRPVYYRSKVDALRIDGA